MRTATPDDAPAILANMTAGIDTYREWAPASWNGPQATPEILERLRARLPDDQVWVLTAWDDPSWRGTCRCRP